MCAVPEYPKALEMYQKRLELAEAGDDIMEVCMGVCVCHRPTPLLRIFRYCYTVQHLGFRYACTILEYYIVLGYMLWSAWYWRAVWRTPISYCISGTDVLDGATRKERRIAP